MSTTIADLLIKIGVSVDGAKQAEKEVEGTTEAAEDTEKKGSPKLKAFAAAAKVAFGAVAVAAVASAGAIAAAGGALFGFADEQTQAMNAIAKGAKQTAISTEEYQRLGHAAKLTGSDIAGIADALKTLDMGMLEAVNTGGGMLFEGLKQLGLGLDDLEGKTGTERLGVIADALAKIDDEGKRSAISMQVLGEGGRLLAPLLERGSAGINAMAGSLEDVFTDDQLAKAEAFQDSIANAKAVLGQAAGELAVALTPALNAGIEVFRQFIAENDELIKQQLPRIFTTITENATKLLPIALKVVGVVADLVEQAEPLIDRFLIFTTGQLEKSLNGTKTAISLLLPIVLKLADAVLDVVEGIEKAYNWAVTLGSIEKNQAGRGSPGFLGDQKDPATGESPNERKARLEKEAQDQWAENDKAARRAKTQQTEATRLARLSRATNGGRTWNAEAQEMAESFGLTRDDIRKHAGTPIPKPGGGKKAPTEAPPKAAHFGDFRDVLAVYMGRSPEEAVQALGTLEKGTMPADHRPETSINITNNITNNYEIEIPVNGATSPQATAEAIRDVLKAEYKKAAAQVPQNIAR